MLKPLSRRTVLRGAGACIGLPLLEAMLPRLARAQTTAPKRFAAIYFSDGVLHVGAPGSATNYWECTPGSGGSSWQLSRTLAALAPYKSQLIYYKGLDPIDLRALNDGHWTPAPSFLTGQRHTSNQEGGQFWLKAAGRSLDQAIAEKLGCTPLNMAPFPVNAIGPSTLPARGVGGFLTNLSWLSQKTVAPRFDASAKVFASLFGAGTVSVPSSPTAPSAPAVDRMLLGRRSILDLVLGEAETLKAKLAASDKQKLDEYMTSIRALERNIAGEPPSTMVPGTPASCSVPASSVFANELVNNRVHFDLGSKNMMDLMLLAFRCDKTRVATLMLDYENDDGRTMRDLISGYAGPGASADPHIVSHHTTAEHTMGLVLKNEWHVKKVAYLLQQMQAVTEGNGKTMLENSLVMFGSGMGDGNYHGGQFPGDGGGCARITAGGLGGQIATNRFIDARNEHHANLLAGIARLFDVRDAAGNMVSTWGFGTGALAL